MAEALYWGGAALQTVVQFAMLAVAVVLYARVLPRRTWFAWRAAVALAVWVGGAALAMHSGYTLFPSISDNASFLAAVATFATELGVLTAGVLLVWQAPPLTALFCSSSAYLVEGVAFGLNRTLHVLLSWAGVVPIESSLLAWEAASLLGSCALVLWLVWHVAARRLEGEALLHVGNAPMLFAVVVALLVTLVLDLAVQDVMSMDLPERYRLVLSGTHVLVCAFVLAAEFEIIYNRRLQASVATMERTMDEQARQFDLSRRTIEAIDRRCHDIRHHVLGMLAGNGSAPPSREQLAAIAREVRIYDASVRTGNAALDVVLTEKGLLCEREGITLSCIADGRALAHMAPADVYALLGTALDNAIDAERGLADPARRTISLTVRSQMGMASVGLKNHRDEPLVIRDGLPVGGGVSLETILGVAGRYGGTVVYSMAGDVASMDVLLPTRSPAGPRDA